MMIMIPLKLVKDAIRDYLQSLHSPPDCLQHICSIGQNTIMCLSLAYILIFSFILLAEIIKQWSTGGNQSTWRKPLTTTLENATY